MIISMTCNQCSNQAMWEIPGGDDCSIYLCLNCYAKYMEISEQKQAALIRSMNQNLALLEAHTGIPTPRHPEPKPKGKITMQHINLAGANVGVVNTGTIKELNGSVSVMAQAGEKNLSAALAEFAQAVLSSKTLEQDQREQILERLSFIAQQATKPKPERSKVLLPTKLLELSGLVRGVEALSTLYESHLKPLFDGLVN